MFMVPGADLVSINLNCISMLKNKCAMRCVNVSIGRVILNTIQCCELTQYGSRKVVNNKK